MSRLPFRNHPKHRWHPGRWEKLLTQRFPEETPEVICRRNEIQLFRLALAAKEPKMTLTLSLDQATPSLNEVNKMHWSQRNKMRGQWQWLVRAAVLNDKVTVVQHQKARVTIERYGPRRLDHDNLVGGAKQLMDSIVREGFVVDDSPEHLLTEYRQHIDRTPRTIVHIEALI